VARNRKRAKERRARRTDSGNGARRAASYGVDPTVGPVGSDGDEGAPNPLEHASPDVEIADAQIAFGNSDQSVPLEQAEVNREQELLEEEFAEERQERTAAATRAVKHERPGLLARLIGFLQGSWRELQRVQWPDRRQVAQATGVVLGFVIVAGAFLGLCDLAFSHLVNYILK
jgi:preprotein translocase SecE subunit